LSRPPVPTADSTRVSVIVCTRDRPALLEACLAALLKQTRADTEVVVVDNAPSDDATVRLCADLPVRYVCEPLPGISRARNRGIAEARGEILAYVDDDTIPEGGWLAAVLAAFQDEVVMVVTGRVEAAELKSEAQRHFEHGVGGMSKGSVARSFARSGMNVQQLIAAQAVGIGANMAFRKDVFEAIGGFDTRLGGTIARGAEDLDVFHRVLAAGMTLRYEPAALVLHRHRPDMASLRRQLFDTGFSYAVYLMLLWGKGTVPRRGLLRYATTWAAWLGWRQLKGLLGRHRLPVSLLWAQLSGALRAPFAYRGIIAEP